MSVPVSASAGYYDYRPFTNRVPILSKSKLSKSSLSLTLSSSSSSSSSSSRTLSSSDLRLRSSPAIQLSGGGQEVQEVHHNIINDDDDAAYEKEEEEIRSFAEESDIMVEIRGGGGSVSVATATTTATTTASNAGVSINVNGSSSNHHSVMGEYHHQHEHELEHEHEHEHEFEHGHESFHLNTNNTNKQQQQQKQQQQKIPTQPLRISTYRKGIRQLRNSERREERRLKRLDKIQKRQLRKEEKMKLREEKSSHMVYAKKLKNRNNLNIRRKVLHAGFGLFFATLNQLLPRDIMIPGMTLLTTCTLAVELLRYRKGFGWMNDAMHFVLGGTLRKQEMEGKFTGSFYYFLGVTLTSYLFPQSCASLGICQLALADPSASFFGRQTRHVYWSRIENGFFGIGRNKGILGFLGGAAFCFPFNYYVLNIAKFGGASATATATAAANVIPGGQSSVALASIALGLAGAFADLCVPTPALTMPKKIMGIPMPRFHVDDNVVVPIVSGYACTKIFEKLGWMHGVDLAKFILF
eukprot:CAMPEP_0203662476 /NCGR_PEP_ID=MMETSP0090-20130426/431_1 /ASSEMBLY_ACC=CAM_ASM_001088 /TAXON_ID=426623 /ORGANISM="Chaetoceros affinis, Strain CCMP159" /LENGTH=524 /DNA_ID=CAMNT_0050525267 /DNA_START=653 /DNA_END=2227 /DNA_ORIENTATION=-